MAEKDVQWTETQRRAIETRGANLLVTASAGTGKTAVLVERSIQLVTDPKEPIDIDRLLVVTFTEAAAAEMRNRLSETLRKRVEEEFAASWERDARAPQRLRRQLILLDRASISTLHSYALRTIQEHFFRLGLSPNLNVMDPEEADLLCAEMLDEVFEALYTDEGEPGQRFRRLVGRYGRNGNDEPVRRVVLGLWSFLRSLPWPEHWREKALASYGSTGILPVCRLEDLPVWYEPFVAALDEDLRRLRGEAAEAEQWAGDTDPSLVPYEDHFESVGEAFETLLGRLANDGYDALQQAVANHKYPKLPTVKGVEEALREGVKRRNDAIREYFYRRIRNDWCALTGEQWVATLQATRPDVETLLDLVDRFDKAFSQAKRERGNVDFQDLERLCFDLLVDRAASSPDRLVPSAAAREIRERYEAVLVDEYQDISPLQDAILHLSSRQDDPRSLPNLFMVGDVKQSIYRFRLAEPEIFLQKMVGAIHELPLRRIDLNENFRSRAPLLSALNAMFRLVLIPEVGKISYEGGELRGGFDYPSDVPPGLPPPTEGVPVEVHFFDRSRDLVAEGANEEEPEAGESAEMEGVEELEQIEIEARWVASRIREMVGRTGFQPVNDSGQYGQKENAHRQDACATEGRVEFSIWDRAAKRYRPVSYRDIAVLLQTAAYKADVFVRVMREMAIPAYTETGGGWLHATEIRDVLSLLELLDNPHQDIAAAAVLRSPLVRLREDDLARLRIHGRDGDFFSAIVAYGDKGPSEPLRRRMREFLTQLERWRTLVRRGPLAQALWAIYDETGYLDYVTAMEDGAQRRANLIGLYDRARQFDEFSRRGLGRFLEFIRRLQETESELGAPPAISEAEDVVRVMSIHKSKGLEFPVVIIPDIGKWFNFMDARGDLVTDRHLGVAVRQVDSERGIKYPTAAHLVVSRQVERETLAEQMRLLYVATTRAREKLILCGSVWLERAPKQWMSRASAGSGAAGPLDPVTVGSARCFADWIGPALARLGYVGERDSGTESSPRHRQDADATSRQDADATGAQLFAVHYHRGRNYSPWRRSSETGGEKEQLRKIASMEAVAAPPHDAECIAQVMERLNWPYQWRPLAGVRGKVSVTELKRRFETRREADETVPDIFAASTIRRPAFITAVAGAIRELPLRAAEIGTAYHTVLRHLDLAQFGVVGAQHAAPMQETVVRRQLEQFVECGLLMPGQAGAVDAAAIVRFLNSSLGVAMRQQPERVRREVPFTLAVSASEAAGAIHELPRQPDSLSENEWVLVQGVIDCLIERPQGFMLIDFKTDRIEADEVTERAEHYRIQMALYARAVETIFGRSVIEQILYFFHPGVAIDLKKRP